MRRVTDRHIYIGTADEEQDLDWGIYRGPIQQHMRWRKTNNKAAGMANRKKKQGRFLIRVVHGAKTGW